MSLLAGVLLEAEVETVLVVSELLAKKETIPHELVTLRGRRRWCCLLAFRLRLGALRGLSLTLTSLGGIGTCLGTSGLCRFASLLI